MIRRFGIPAAVLLAAMAIAVVLYLFQPWRIFTSSTVSEDVPTVLPQTSQPAGPSDEPTPPAPRELATGQLISHEHSSSGAVKIIELPDGSRILRFEGLDTSDGPDLRVWLSDAPVIEGPAGWYLFDDGAHLDLGALKANKGDQNYEIPPGTNLANYSSVSIWCARFAVSFAAAELTG
ncbi:DM13 domain-containing protein [uncultured Arthrobacter sp.]|uniref:DM13 domain-containing protein n=1 Tax=uncultured Arthrobacter sp. TaxID=114050 RepID=UPI0032173E55